MITYREIYLRRAYTNVHKAEVCLFFSPLKFCRISQFSCSCISWQ